jgi:hypothetical protein
MVHCRMLYICTNRSQLAYFAKRIYRPLFLHEEAVIRTLQAFVRACMFTKRWHLAKRAHHLRKLSALHKQLLLQPYNAELRNAVKQSCSDSYTSMHHDVHKHCKLHIQQVHYAHLAMTFTSSAFSYTS